MASHFSAIGFPVHTPEEMNKVVLQARDSGQVVKARQGFYKVWTVANAVEMWVGCHQATGLTANPHFSGAGRMKVRVTEIIPSEGYPMEGSIRGWADPDPRKPDDGAYPLMLDLPDFDAVRRDLRTGSIITMQVAAFAHDLACFVNDEAFSDSQGEVKFAPESFITTGLFSVTEEPVTPTAMGMFAGHVEEAHLLKNPETGASFYHLVVRTLGGTVDVVADPESIEGRPTVGGVVQGSFWLSGRVVQEPAPRGGILKRLFGSKR